MTTRRSPPPTSHPRSKKASKKKSSAKKKPDAKKRTTKKKTIATKKPRPYTDPHGRPKLTKAQKRAGKSIRRKPEAPDMSAYIRSARDLSPEQIAEAKLTVVRVLCMKGNLREATDAAGVHRTQAYEWKRTDEPFSEAWEAALEEAADRIEQEMWRRGVEGYDHPVIYQGEITDTYKEYSDSLLTLLAKGNRASKYKERTEVSTPPGQPLELKAETKADVISSILGLIKNKPDPT